MDERIDFAEARPEAYGWETPPRWSRRGSGVRTMRVAELLLKETTFPADTRVPLHDHPLSKVTFTLAGGCTERRSGGAHRSEPGTLRVNPAGSSHAYRTGLGGLRIFSATFGPAWDGRLAGLRIDPLAASRSPRLVSLAWRLHQEFLRPDELSPLVMEELLADLVDRVFGDGGESEGEPRWLERLLSLVHDTFSEPMGLSDYAEEIGIDRSHLARTFRNRFGCTLGQYVRGLRVARARLLLMESDRPLAEVAQAAGFSDQSHMGRTFRRLLGPTPGEVRGSVAESPGRAVSPS